MTDLFAGKLAIRVEIPSEATAKGRGKPGRVRTKGGGEFITVRTPTKTRNAEAFVKERGVQAMGGRPPVIGAVGVCITIYRSIAPSWPKKKQAAARAGDLRPTSKPDWDNYAKLLGDAWNTVVWMDDSQIVDGTCRKFYADVPRTVVEVVEL